MTEARHALSRTAPGDHIILVYEDRAELYDFVVPFIKNGLDHGERCVYVAAESNPADLAAALSAGGIRVDRETQRGALVFMTPREFHGGLPLEPTRVVRRLNELVEEARAAGFAGLRAAGEMTWAGRKGVPPEVLGEYEALLEKVTGRRRPTLACIYRRDRFDPEMLERLVRLHGKVVAKDYVFLSLGELFRSLSQTDLRRLAHSAVERIIRKGGTRRGTVIKMPLSRRDLAEMTGTSPYTISRILAEWRRQDILDAQRSRIVIRDRERLAETVGAGAAPPSFRDGTSGRRDAPASKSRGFSRP